VKNRELVDGRGFGVYVRGDARIDPPPPATVPARGGLVVTVTRYCVVKTTPFAALAPAAVMAPV
jgi:hypothetical protein